MTTPGRAGRFTCVSLVIGIGAASVVAQEAMHIESGSYCMYTGQGSLDTEIYTFSSDAEATGVLRDMLRHIGMGSARLPFELRAADVPNAVAFNDRSRRVILYNQQFMERIRSRTASDWSMVAVLAHEVGHHIMGHTLIPGGSRPPTELEADKFSGFALYRMGADLEESLAVFNLFPDAGSDTHPGRGARVAAVTNGWIEARELAEGDGPLERSGRDDRTRPSPDSGIAQLGSNAGELTASDLDDEQDRPYDDWWYRASAGQVVTVSALSDDFDTYLAVFGLDNDKPMGSDDDGGSGTDARVTVRFDQAGRHRIRVRAYARGEWGRYELELSSQKNRKQTPASSTPRLPPTTPRGGQSSEESGGDFGWRVVFYADATEYLVSRNGTIVGRGAYGIREVGEKAFSNDPRFAWLYVTRLGPTYGVTAGGQVIGTDMYGQPMVIGHVVQLR